jgi:hypothetical protein
VAQAPKCRSCGEKHWSGQPHGSKASRPLSTFTGASTAIVNQPEVMLDAIESKANVSEQYVSRETYVSRYDWDKRRREHDAHWREING